MNSVPASCQTSDGMTRMKFDFSSVRYRRELNRHDLERMRIPKRYWNVRFDDISNRKLSGSHYTVREVIKMYIDDMEKNRREGNGFIFWGNNGSGKSSISVVIAKEFRRRGNTVLFMEAADLKRQVIEREYFDDDETYWDRAKTVDVLVLDDFGKGIIDSTGFGATIFDELIRARNSRQLVTIITSNFAHKDWEKELELKTSTIHALKECMLPVKVVGEDKREATENRLMGLIYS